MEKNEKELERYKQFTEWYLDHIALYRRQLSLDMEISKTSKEKMQILLDELVVQFENFLATIAKTQRINVQQIQGLETTETEDQLDLKGIFDNLILQFSDLATISPKLLEIKRRLEDKITFYDNLHADKKKERNTGSQKSSVESNKHSTVMIPTNESAAEPITNDKWLDSLMADISQKNEKLRSFEQFKAKKSGKTTKRPEEKKDMTNYFTAFKTIQSEFDTLKCTLKNCEEDHKNHQHSDLETRIEKINTETIKIETDYKVMQREHSEMLHNLHILSISLCNLYSKKS